MTIPQYIQRMVQMYQKLAEQVVLAGNNRSLLGASCLKLLHFMLNTACSHHTVQHNWINGLNRSVWYVCTQRERSSAVEHSVHIGVVTGSIPVAPTTPSRKYPTATIDQQRLSALWA